MHPRDVPKLRTLPFVPFLTLWLHALSSTAAFADDARPMPPALPATFGGSNEIPLDGGRTQSIAVSPKNRDHVIIATEWGGLWRTFDGGARWEHLDGLPAVLAKDVAYAADGRTLIATKVRDNAVVNGGGIWVSRDEGGSWTKPPSADPPASTRSPARITAYGVSWAPDEPRRAYVGTDFGVAITSDGGETFTHVAVETTSPVNRDHTQSTVQSVLALPKKVVLAATSTGIYRSDTGGASWRSIRSGDFSANFKLLDVSPVDSNVVFILQSYSTLFVYEVATDAWTQLALPGGQSRDPFVRVARAAETGDSIDVWLGLGADLRRATCADLACVKALVPASWSMLGRPEGIHDDSGHLGLDARGRPVMYGSDGGVFKPVDGTAKTWTRAALPGSGLNSYQITGLAGTNVEHPTRPKTSLYFGTQDNGLWASGDGGDSWPASDCTEGFRLEAPPRAVATTRITVGYGKVGCGPSNAMFSDADFANQRAVPDVDGSKNPVSDLSTPFLVSGRRWIRYRSPPSASPELWVSTDDGAHWRRRATVDLQVAGIPKASIPLLPRGQSVVLMPFYGAQTSPTGDRLIGLIRLTTPFAAGEIKLGETDLIYLPAGGSLGVRATQFDWQAVFAVHPQNPSVIIAPDIVNDCVRVTRDGGVNFPCDADLTALVLQDGKLRMYDGDPWHMEVTHVKFDDLNPRSVYVGTRDAGVFTGWSLGDWRAITGTERISYLTGFFTRPGGIVVASSYGQGLWEIDPRSTVRPFRPDRYCKRPCVRVIPEAPGPVSDPDWQPWLEDKETIIVLGGQIVGLERGERGLVQLFVTPGGLVRRFVPKGVEAVRLEVRESSKGTLPKALSRRPQLTGIVLGPSREPLAYVSGPLEEGVGEERSSAARTGKERPYLLVSGTGPGNGEVFRPSDRLHLTARGFVPGKIVVEVDGMNVEQITAERGGAFAWSLGELDRWQSGLHRVRFIQKTQDRTLQASATFALSDADDHFEERREEQRMK